MTISESDQTYFILREILIHDTDQFIPHLKSAIEKGYDVNHTFRQKFILIYIMIQSKIPLVIQHFCQK